MKFSTIRFLVPVMSMAGIMGIAPAFPAEGYTRVEVARRVQAALDRYPLQRSTLAGELQAQGLAIVDLRIPDESAGANGLLVTGAGKSFRDCPEQQRCPEMVVVPTAPVDFKIGSPPDEAERVESEEQFAVRISAFAIGKFEVSTAEYMACVSAMACRAPEWLEPGGTHNIETGTGVTYKGLAASIKGDDQPVVGISWDDATAYAAWLSGRTGLTYRLPSEAEWEFAARGGTTTRYWWGNEPQFSGKIMACCRGCGSERDANGFYPIQSFSANPFGLHNVHGNVWEWVADYYCESYASGPNDGSARTGAHCPGESGPTGLRIFRGGSCFYEPRQMRAAMRLRNTTDFRNQTVGFRIARTIETTTP